MNPKYRHKLANVATASALLLASSNAALAVIQTVTSLETPNCDVLPNLTVVDELGLVSVFPAGERIDANATQTTLVACAMSDNPTIPNALVRMTNLNNIAFTDMFYVADPATPAPGTSISNEDGLVNFGQAFRIDTIGMNHPLIFESQIADGIFAPGEQWQFIIDDYANSLGIPAHAFLSIGVGIASGPGGSSGSIIALIPEPASLGMFSAAACLFIRRRR